MDVRPLAPRVHVAHFPILFQLYHVMRKVSCGSCTYNNAHTLSTGHRVQKMLLWQLHARSLQNSKTSAPLWWALFKNCAADERPFWAADSSSQASERAF